MLQGPIVRWGLFALLVLVGGGSVLATDAAASDHPTIRAESAIVVDAVTGQVLFDKNASTQLPPASLTKLFTAFAALEVADLNQQMTVAPSDLVGEASMGLTAGEVLPFEALLYGMLLPSGNDAASTVARNLSGSSTEGTATGDDAFMAYLNGRIADLGLNGTRLENPHGLDQEGHVSTAYDIAKLTIYAMATEPAFAQAIAATSYSRFGHQLQQTNELHATYPGLIGGKTGVTREAGYSLMEVAERDGRRVVVVLLGSTAEAWYADARALLDYGFTALATPGAPVYGQITFQPAPVEAVGAAGSLTVSQASAEAAIVSVPASISPKPQPAWFWALSALVVLPCLGVITLQTRKLVELMRRRSARRVAPAASPVTTFNPAHSFATSTTWTIPPAYRDRGLAHRSRSAAEQYAPIVAPSFSE